MSEEEKRKKEHEERVRKEQEEKRKQEQKRIELNKHIIKGIGSDDRPKK
jgi:hypothetical protein